MCSRTGAAEEQEARGDHAPAGRRDPAHRRAALSDDPALNCQPPATRRHGHRDLRGVRRGVRALQRHGGLHGHVLAPDAAAGGHDAQQHVHRVRPAQREAPRVQSAHQHTPPPKRRTRPALTYTTRVVN